MTLMAPHSLGQSSGPPGRELGMHRESVTQLGWHAELRIPNSKSLRSQWPEPLYLC